jgi:hypothetical protein
MRKIKLPVIKGPLPGPPVLSMDDYYKFVEFHWKYTFDKKADAEWRKKARVNVPFSIIK